MESWSLPDKGPGAIPLLEGMLNEDPAAQLSLADIRDHPWFTEVEAPPLDSSDEDLPTVDDPM